MRINKYWVCTIKKKRGETVEELIQESKVPLEHMFKIMKILVQSGASRQEHQNKERHTKKDDGLCCKQNNS